MRQEIRYDVGMDLWALLKATRQQHRDMKMTLDIFLLAYDTHKHQYGSAKNLVGDAYDAMMADRYAYQIHMATRYIEGELPTQLKEEMEHGKLPSEDIP